MVNIKEFLNIVIKKPVIKMSIIVSKKMNINVEENVNIIIFQENVILIVNSIISIKNQAFQTVFVISLDINTYAQKNVIYVKIFFANWNMLMKDIVDVICPINVMKSAKKKDFAK